MRARPPWTGWSRSRSGASPSPPPPRPASGTGTASTGSTSSIPRATWTSPSRWSARSACSTARSTLLDSVAGVEPQTETVWRQADRYGVPRLIFANKMDRVGADFDRCLAMIRDRLTKKAYPDPAAGGLGRDVHRAHRRAPPGRVIFDEETLGKTFTEMPVPEAYKERVEAARHEVIEAAVEHDEELLEKYLGGDGALRRRDPARHPEGDVVRGRSCRCSAARRSRTRASRRCSTR